MVLLANRVQIELCRFLISSALPWLRAASAFVFRLPNCWSTVVPLAAPIKCQQILGSGSEFRWISEFRTQNSGGIPNLLLAQWEPCNHSPSCVLIPPLNQEASRVWKVTLLDYCENVHKSLWAH